MLKSERSRTFCSCASGGISISEYRGCSFKSASIKYLLLSAWVIFFSFPHNLLFGNRLPSSHGNADPFQYLVQVLHRIKFLQNSVEQGCRTDSPATILSIEKSCRHIQIVLTAVCGIPFLHLCLETIGVPAIRCNLFQIFKIVDFYSCILQILRCVV